MKDEEVPASFSSTNQTSSNDAPKKIQKEHVWIRQGKQDHLALLLSPPHSITTTDSNSNHTNDDISDKDGKKWIEVKWCSTGKIDKVPMESVRENVQQVHRQSRRRRQVTCYGTSGDSRSYRSSGSSSKPNRLSLTTKRRRQQTAMEEQEYEGPSLSPSSNASHTQISCNILETHENFDIRKNGSKEEAENYNNDDANSNGQGVVKIKLNQKAVPETMPSSNVGPLFEYQAPNAATHGDSNSDTGTSLNSDTSTHSNNKNAVTAKIVTIDLINGNGSDETTNLDQSDDDNSHGDQQMTEMQHFNDALDEKNIQNSTASITIDASTSIRNVQNGDTDNSWSNPKDTSSKNRIQISSTPSSSSPPPILTSSSSSNPLFQHDTSETSDIGFASNKVTPQKLFHHKMGTESSLKEQNTNTSKDDENPMTAKNSGNNNKYKSNHRKMIDYQNSPYLQNLAEICHTVLHDVRWRVDDTDNTSQNKTRVREEHSPQQDLLQHQKRLFRWEDGDDLSALWALERLYIPLTNGGGSGVYQKKEVTCHRKSASPSVENNCVANDGNNAQSRENVTNAKVENETLNEYDSPSSLHRIFQNHCDEHNNDDETKETVHDHERFFSSTIENYKNEQEARCMNLYSRLFYRKGPWFTLDDLFVRYYHRDYHRRAVATGYRAGNETGKDTVRCDIDISGDCLGDVDKKNINDFSTLRGTTSGTRKNEPAFSSVANGRAEDNGSEDARRESSSFSDPASFHGTLYEHCRLDTDKDKKMSNLGNENERNEVGTSLAQNCKSTILKRAFYDFFCDVQRLFSMGLIRTFISEEECGIVVGNFDRDNGNSGAVLTEKDRQALLRKLGGGGKKNYTRNQRQPMTVGKGMVIDGDNDFWTTSLPNKKRPHFNRRTGKNDIWKQMRSQRSIFFSGRKKSLLPVKHHLNDILLHNLVIKVVSILQNDNIESSGGGDDVTDAFRTYRCGELGSLENFSFIPKVDKDSIRQNIRHLKGLWEVTHSFMSSKNLTVPFFMCFRLREEPLMTLRRASRLYICAEGGAGNMRWDGTNAWLPVKERPAIPDEENDANCAMLDNLYSTYTLPLPPSTSSWHKVIFPGLNFRIGLLSCSFFDNYKPLLIERITSKRQGKNLRLSTIEASMLHVFKDSKSYHLWELCAEIRNAIDYLVEWNSMILYADRKIKSNKKLKKERTADQDESGDSNYCSSKSFADFIGIISPPEISERIQVLSMEGRKDLIKSLMGFTAMKEANHVVDDDLVDRILQNVERAIHSLCIQNEVIPPETTENLCLEGQDAFLTDAERMICSISIVCQHVLLYRFQTIPLDNIHRFVKRPWLRHLSWESVLAYVLWDCVDIIEKRGYYKLAVSILETILFGSSVDTNKISTACKEGENYENCSEITMLTKIKMHENDSIFFSFVIFLLSRRVRGKAMERFVIDRNHLLRNQRVKEKELMRIKKENRELKKKKLKINPLSIKSDVQRLCTEIISVVADDGSIPFSFVRKLARRIRLPLATILNEVWNIEMMELGIRLKNIESVDSNSPKKKGTKQISYSDWSPVTDISIANSIRHDSADHVGKRCAYVSSNEANSQNMEFPRSLKVEELAMQEYASGRLPKESLSHFFNKYKGGWVGWHDEGLHVRALFRILCSRPLLGHVFGNALCEDDFQYSSEQATIFLTPYQNVPLDLHVANSNHGILSSSTGIGKSFYERRRRKIEEFLGKLEMMEAQNICDLVYETIIKQKDGQQYQRDMNEIRTLSLLAAGFGGAMLAAIFRCLCFDYRHYSAGLPDLLLVRATYAFNSSTEKSNNSQAIALNEWIGESFESHSIGGNNTTILTDRDDEFLSCSLSEKRISYGGLRRKIPPWKNDDMEETCISNNAAPKKLLLIHDGKDVVVECMFVEVKSANDSLDERQEDWLNILDRVGNARVCKFLASKK